MTPGRTLKTPDTDNILFSEKTEGEGSPVILVLLAYLKCSQVTQLAQKDNLNILSFIFK